MQKTSNCPTDVSVARHKHAEHAAMQECINLVYCWHCFYNILVFGVNVVSEGYRNFSTNLSLQAVSNALIWNFTNINPIIDIQGLILADGPIPIFWFEIH